MRPFLRMLAVTLALSVQADIAAQDEYVTSPRELLAQANEIENKDPKAAAEIIKRALPKLQNTEDAALNREAQTRLCMTTVSFDPAAALSIAQQGLVLARMANDVKAEPRLLLCEGNAHEKLGDTAAASVAYLSGLAVAEKAGDKEFLSEKNLRPLIQFYDMRVRNFAKHGDFQSAHEAGNELRMVQRQLNIRLLEDQAAKFERERAELENKVMLIENERIFEAQFNEEKQRNLWWQVVTLGTVLLALLLILSLWQFYKKRRTRILSMTDELTKLPNRQHILTFLGDQAKNAYEEEQPLSVITFDIDNFKQVNDKNGHEGGDLVIKTVADVSNQALRRGDRIGRLGGKEFLVVLPGSPRRPAVDVAERLRRSIEVTEMDKLTNAPQVTISLGVCEWNAGHESIDALLKRTHGALDEAKKSGRNCVVAK